jgi:putative Mg2+ transporter-C (MgtC) family protein
MVMDTEPLLRILLAAVLSLPIGLEREISGKDAGLRTHLLLAIATAGLGWLSLEAAEGRGPGADPTRIASYTVAGIGFLGAGLIVAIRGRVHGLTTAVAAFTVMAIGLLSGMGEVSTAIAVTLVSLLTLGPLDWVKPRTYGRFVRETAVPTVQECITDHEVQVQAMDFVPLNEGVLAVHISVRGRRPQLVDAVEQLRAVPGVMSAVSVATGSVTSD